jgi:hypothetical protein
MDDLCEKKIEYSTSHNNGKKQGEQDGHGFIEFSFAQKTSQGQ